MCAFWTLRGVRDPDSGPLACRKAWLLPILAPLLPHVLARLSNDWGRVVASTGAQAAIAAANGALTTEASSAAEDDVIAERQLHELTSEHFSLLVAVQDSCEPLPLPPYCCHSLSKLPHAATTQLFQ